MNLITIHSSRLLQSTSCALLFLLYSFFHVQAQRLQDQELDGIVRQGIFLAGQQQYSKAREYFTKAIQHSPNHPAGYLNQAILMEVMSLDFEIPVSQPDFTKMLEQSLELAQKMLATNERSVEANYYLGMTHSYIAYYKFRDGENWLSGLTHGMKASSFLTDCLEFDPAAYDAMTGVGTYKYWKSRKMSFLTWTPFVEDERFEGINFLKLAEAKAFYTNAQATNSLIWIYIDEERYDEAMRCAKNILRKFPRNRLFLWGLASAAEKKEDWATARSAYRRIATSIDSNVVETRYIEIQARAKVASTSFHLGDYKLAAKECTWVLRNSKIDLTSFTSDGATRIKKRVADMEELKNELSKIATH